MKNRRSSKSVLGKWQIEKHVSLVHSFITKGSRITIYYFDDGDEYEWAVDPSFSFEEREPRKNPYEKGISTEEAGRRVKAEREKIDRAEASPFYVRFTLTGEAKTLAAAKRNALKALDAKKKAEALLKKLLPGMSDDC